MSTVSEFFKYLANSNAINFIIMIALLLWICNKMKIGNVIENLIDSTKKIINDSEEKKQTSNLLLAEAEKNLAKLPEDIEALENSAAEKANVLTQQIKNSTQKSIEDIVANMGRVIKIEERNLDNSVTAATVKKSVQQAKDNIINRLAQNPELHKEFIEESLAEFGKVRLL